MMKSVEMAMPGRAARSLRTFSLYSSDGVAALHERKHAVRAALHRQVQVIRELAARSRYASMRAVRQLERMRRGEANALDAGHLRNVMDQRREIDAASHPPSALRTHSRSGRAASLRARLARRADGLPACTDSNGRLTSSPRV